MSTTTITKAKSTTNIYVSMEIIEKVKKERTASYEAHGGSAESLTPWDDLTPKERFAAIQAFA